MLNESQMATEKLYGDRELSDGICLFARDLGKLRSMVQQRLKEAA